MQRPTSLMTGLCDPFRHRVLLYRQWDRELFHRTRFFAAAAVTNVVLADLFSRAAAQIWLAPATQAFLLDAGRVLETLNTEIADELIERPVASDNLDVRLVAIEQSALERVLRTLQATDAPAHAVVTAQLDRLLDTSRWCYLRLFDLHPGTCVYERVLTRVRRELRRPIRFALQSDREHIGRTVIALLPTIATLPAEQVFQADRERSHPYPGGMEDSIGHSGVSADIAEFP